MDMPHGWEIFCSSYKLGSGTPVRVSWDKQEEAAQLLKEMAEALEEVKKALQVGDFSNKQLDLIYDASTKFKEWK